MILSNGRGLTGKETEPVLLSTGFMLELIRLTTEGFEEKKAMLQREFEKPEEVQKEDIYDYLTISSNRATSIRLRMTHHLTKTDLMVAVVLSKICQPLTHEIKFIQYATIHRAIHDYYEDSVTLHEVKNAVLKLRQLGVIELTYEADNRINITLLHTEKENGRFILAHPVIFTKAFTELTVAHWKLFFWSYLRTGQQKNHHLFPTFDTLNLLLHRQNSDCKKIIEELIDKDIWNGESLFVYANDQKKGIFHRLYEKKGKSFHKANFAINPAFILKHEQGKEYQDIIPVTDAYPRIRIVIEDCIDRFKLREWIPDYQKKLEQMIYILKGFGKKAIEFAIENLARITNKIGYFPAVEFRNTLRRDARSKIKRTVIDLSKKTGVYPWIVSSCKSITEEQARLEEFVNKMSWYPIPHLRKAFVHNLPFLQNLKTEDVTIDDYNSGLHVEIPSISAFRKAAFEKKMSPYEYRDLESIAKKRIQKGETPLHVGAWIFEQIRDYVGMPVIPITDQEFKVEDIFIRTIKKTK